MDNNNPNDPTALSGIFGSYSMADSKPLTNEMLKEMIDKLNKMEPPKAILLMPCFGCYTMYEIDQQEAKQLLKPKGSL